MGSVTFSVLWIFHARHDTISISIDYQRTILDIVECRTSRGKAMAFFPERTKKSRGSLKCDGGRHTDLYSHPSREDRTSRTLLTPVAASPGQSYLGLSKPGQQSETPSMTNETRRLGHTNSHPSVSSSHSSNTPHTLSQTGPSRRTVSHAYRSTV